MDYQEALSWIHGTLKFGIKPGVRRMEWLLRQLGNPQDKICGLHIVGTNGKGSTVNYLQTIFTKAGYQAGTFTSPYIMDFRERITVNGQMISKNDLVDLVQRVKPVVERLPEETDLGSATEFEIITTMMFLYFGERHPVDIVLVEAGLGGLYDSTNVFKPQAVICTSIGLDHQDILGQSYQEIASQKAGVLKKRIPFIFAEDHPDVKAVFDQKAKEIGCPTYELGRAFQLNIQGDRFDFCYDNVCLENLKSGMPGRHQINNAALAVMACLLLQDKFPNVSKDLMKEGLLESHWLGRTELLKPNLMIDGAHNNESISVLVALLKERYPDKQIHVLFAAINTKPIDSMLEQLDQFQSLSVTSFDYPKAFELDDYPETYQRVSSYKDWLKHYQPPETDQFYLITGSLYFISEVRKWFLKSAAN